MFTSQEHYRISGLGICSFAPLLIAHLLKIDHDKWKYEQFTQIAQDKWVTMSESLRSLMKKSGHKQIAWVAHALSQRQFLGSKHFKILHEMSRDT